MGAGILSLLCLGGIGVAISFYDQATEIKRTDPDAVVDSFLAAYLVNRNDQEASLYMCESGGDFAAIEAYRSTITQIEKDRTIGINVSWSGLVVTTNGSEGTVSVELVQTSTDKNRLGNDWRFGVVDRDGWRVCSATSLS